ncbi:MAG TPA: penicillin-binding protein 1C, partial [Bacteroidota bacterium]
MRRLLLNAMLIGTGSLFLGLAVLMFVFPLPNLKPYSRTITDRNGQLLHAFLASDDRWRLETKPDEIPQKLKTILLYKEDRYFYYHPGVNPLSAVRAFFQNLESGERRSGASTITMQVARILEPKERTYWAKLVESFRALQLELKYTKDEILEMYLSMVPLGGNIEGLNSAALLYYQTPLERIDIAHLIDLILIPNDPNRLRPDRGEKRLYEERIRNAARWITVGLLTEEDSLIVWETPAGAERVQPPQRAPHFSLRVTQAGLHDGPAIRTTLDANIQRTAERLLASHMRVWRQKGVANGAVLVVDNKTREMLAYVGSPDFEDSTIHGQVDGVRAIRSPGSALKPFLIALRIDGGMLTPKRVLLDTPYDAEGFYAENYDGTFSGTAYVDQALRRSLNVPMIRTLQETGVPDFANHLVKAGFTSLESQKAGLGLSMVVGGCGVTLEELTAAYLIFPNGGSYAPLRAVVDHGEGALREVYSPATSYMITEILAGLDRPDLP